VSEEPVPPHDHDGYNHYGYDHIGHDHEGHEHDEPRPDAVDAILSRLDKMLKPEIGAAKAFEHRFAPAWQRVTEGEARWAVGAAIAVSIALQLTLPERLTPGPTWLLPTFEGLLLIVVLVSGPRRLNHHTKGLRSTAIALTAVLSFANAWAAFRMIRGLVTGIEKANAQRLLLTGAVLWITNVIAFGIWYWQLDRGGPVARSLNERDYPAFLFPQMSSPELAPPDWEPFFVDYLYLSFTNATAFSPTDTVPLNRWAKALMLTQSAVSLVTVALVIARAVNILG
jgi:uncharacterized membrane protein